MKKRIKRLDLGSFLKKLRKAKGKTQPEIASHGKIRSTRTISYWEHGVIARRYLDQIPDIYEMTDEERKTFSEIANAVPQTTASKPRQNSKDKTSQALVQILQDFVALSQKDKKKVFQMLKILDSTEDNSAEEKTSQ